ncbi:MAG: RNA 3'-terminal phosphate cyclase [Nitrospirota bacterium]
MIEIDGSHGEGGGQILRTSLSLSCLLKTPFRIFNIRRGRKRPGLMPQHLTCVRAATLISNAEMKGDYEGSMELIFKPEEVKFGDYYFDIGTAGSTSLLLQSLLPPLIFSEGKSTITLKGGTHVPFSPPFHYLSDVFVPMLGKLGIKLSLSIESYGFYPRGGGKITAEIHPTAGKYYNAPLILLDRGEIRYIKGISGVGKLPLSIAERQRTSALNILTLQGFQPEIEIIDVPTPGQGTFVFLKAETDTCIAGFSSLGERGKKAEVVGEEVAKEFLEYYSADACLDPHMADQIVIYLSLASGESSFTTSRISNHLLTSLWIIENFLGVEYKIVGKKGYPGRVTISK